MQTFFSSLFLQSLKIDTIQQPLSGKSVSGAYLGGCSIKPCPKGQGIVLSSGEFEHYSLLSGAGNLPEKSFNCF